MWQFDFHCELCPQRQEYGFLERKKIAIGSKRWKSSGSSEIEDRHSKAAESALIVNVSQIHEH